MERTLTAHTMQGQQATILQRIVPLWRGAAFLSILFFLIVAGVLVRLDVQQLRKDMDRTSRATLEAQVLHDRLVLEMESRRRAVAMETAAAQLDLGPTARLLEAPVQ